MPSSAETAVARTIGIDTGKNTLHMIGLDEKGAISVGARHPGSAGASFPATAAAADPGDADRCAIAPNGQDHWGPYDRLEVSR